MNRMFPLIYNELMKTYIRKSTWVMYAILAVIIVGLGVLLSVFGDELDLKEYSDENWQEELQEENEKAMEIDQKDSEDISQNDFIYMGVDIGKNNYYLEHDIKPAPYDMWAFIDENKDLLSLVSLLTIIIAAGIVANEFRWGTIKLLLIRPIPRSAILLSKYIAVLLFALFTLLFVVLVSLVVGAIFFGFNGFNPNVVVSQNDGFAYVSQVGEILSGYGYKLINLVMMGTFAFMISSVFRNSAMAIGVAIFLMFTGSTIVTAFAQYDWAKYILFANTDLSQYANGGTPWIEGMTLGFSITMLIIYYAIFMVLSWIFFTKRDVAGQ